MQGEVAFEAQEKVLPEGVDRPHPAALQALGPAVSFVTPLRRLDRHDRLAYERAADSPRGVVDCVAFGHRFKGRRGHGWGEKTPSGALCALWATKNSARRHEGSGR